MNLGISTYALTWAIGVPGYDRPDAPLTFIDILETAQQHDIHIVQFADNLPLHKLRYNELEELKSASHKMNIQIELGTRGTDPAHLLTYIEIAEQLDASILRTLITDHDLELARNEIIDVLPHLDKLGVSLAIENHGLHTTKQLIKLFEEIDHPLVGNCLDTVNSFGALECPEQVIGDLAPYVLNLHIKDFDITRVDHQMGFNITGTPAGYGQLDMSHLLSTIRRHNKTPNMILELWTPFTNTVEETIKLENEWFIQSLDFLKNLKHSIEGDVI